MKIWNYIRKPDVIIWFEYGLLAIVVLGVLLLPGYILTLDLVFSPHIQLPSTVTNTLPLQVLLWLMGHALPGDAVEKIVLFSILILSGVGVHLVVRSIEKHYPNWKLSWTWSAYFAGVFYMINPFTYSRFMAGQWMVLLGYALFPFFVRAVIALFRQQKIAQAVRVGVWATVTVIASVHFAGIVIGVLFGAFVIAAIKHHWQFYRLLAVAVGTTLLLSSYWWLPAVFGFGVVGSAVNGFNEAHFDAFATNGHGSLGAIGEVIRLQGFWVESRGLYALPQEKIPLWGLLFAVIWGLVVCGVVVAWKYARLLAYILITAVLAGVILAATPIITILKDSLPFIAGYREPHKFTAMIAFGYAVLGGLGAGYIGSRMRRMRLAIGIGVIVLPLLITPVMLFGFGGQLKLAHYPQEWFELNRTLKDQDAKKVLFLPWHQYGKYSFTDRIIANPSEVFFEVPVISSDNPEYNNVPPTVYNQEKRDIEQALQQKDISDIMKGSGISHVIILKEQDFKTYDFINDTSGLRKTTENEKYIMYVREGES